MRKKLYEFVKNNLQGTGAACIGLWNEQVRFIEEEPPFALPAVFVEFLPIKWVALTSIEYEADIAMRLHILTDSRVERWEDAISAFDLMDDIMMALHGAQDKAKGIGKIVCTASDTDNSFSEIMHNIETYECHCIHTFF